MTADQDQRPDRRFSLRRWSNRKLAAANAGESPLAHLPAETVTPAPAETVTAVTAAPQALITPAPHDEPLLPAVDTLTFDSDFSAFMQPRVAETVKREALKKLFADPRFNVMDGLDTYIDDYSIPSPLDPEIIKDMVHARYTLNPPKTRVNAAGHVEDVPPEEDVAPEADVAQTRMEGANANDAMLEPPAAPDGAEHPTLAVAALAPSPLHEDTPVSCAIETGMDTLILPPAATR